jgi:CDGSH-type Zn-finger protein
MENGPNVVFIDGEAFGAMCRCGASTKPYCDGTHARVGFKAGPAELQLIPLQKRRSEQS